LFTFRFAALLLWALGMNSKAATMTKTSPQAGDTRRSGPQDGPMQLWVVRHGSAGDRREWAAPDEERPLDETGVGQARGLARLLGGQAPTRLRASATRRCVQTLEPLADRLGLAVEPWPELRPGGHPGGLLTLLAETARRGEVVCTHGETMDPALEQLRRGGATIVGDPAALLAKAAVWHLDLDRLVLTLHRLGDRLPPVLAAAAVGGGPGASRRLVSPARAARAARDSWGSDSFAGPGAAFEAGGRP
jgi:phosphohistidine phosphatase SixA